MGKNEELKKLKCELNEKQSALQRLEYLTNLGYNITGYGNCVRTPSGYIFDKDTAERELNRHLVLGNSKQAEALRSLEFLEDINILFPKNNSREGYSAPILIPFCGRVYRIG